MPISQSRMISLIRAAEAYLFAYENLVEAIEQGRYMPPPEAQVHVLTALAAYTIPAKANGTIRVESYHFKKFSRANERNAKRMAAQREPRAEPKKRRSRYNPGPQHSTPELAQMVQAWEPAPGAEPILPEATQEELFTPAPPPAPVLDPNPQFTEHELAILPRLQAHLREHQPLDNARLVGWLLKQIGNGDRLFELIERAKQQGMLVQDASGKYITPA